VWKRGYGQAIRAPLNERNGNRQAKPKTTAPHLDSTEYAQARHTRREAGRLHGRRR
jgi:hypothetical protein